MNYVACLIYLYILQVIWVCIWVYEGMSYVKKQEVIVHLIPFCYVFFGIFHFMCIINDLIKKFRLLK